MNSHSDVIVVGGGPVGLALAMELAQRGVVIDIVEPCEEPSTRTHPRARYVNLRVAEHFRRWKIADRMREIAIFPQDWPSDVVFMTQLDGWEITRVRDAFLSAPVRSEHYPEPAIQLVQSQVEIVLREALAAYPNVNFHFGWSCERVIASDQGVEIIAQKVGTSDSKTLRARFLAGCDGASSSVRRNCGFDMVGKTRVAENVQIIFRSSDFYRKTDVGPAMMYWSLNEKHPAFVSPINTTDRFFVSLHKIADFERLKAQSREIVAAVLGPSIQFEILDLDHWMTNTRIASNYRQGRVFLVGDSAHQHPTYGGHGLNLGVSDAVDLGWKLAAAVKGWSSDALLDTYDEERRPIGQQILAETSQTFSTIPRDLFVAGMEGGDDEAQRIRAATAELIQSTKTRQFRSVGTQLGYNYIPSSIVQDEGTGGKAWNTNEYNPTGQPGSIAPHSWLSENESLYDRLGRWFTVLTFSADEITVEQAKALSNSCPWHGAPCSFVHIPSKSLQSLYGASIAIVRPDQHIAWRGNSIDHSEVRSVWHLITASRK